jgi:hypothetical protein
MGIHEDPGENMSSHPLMCLKRLLKSEWGPVMIWIRTGTQYSLAYRKRRLNEDPDKKRSSAFP